MKRQFAVCYDGRTNNGRTYHENETSYRVIFKDPEDLVWSTYLADLDEQTAKDVADAMNVKEGGF